jgi:hypothetical protein
MKYFYKAQEFIADRIETVQYPKPTWQRTRDDKPKLPWTTRVLLALFGFLIIGFALGIAAILCVFFYGALS